ncbi:MAG: hypothetical protein HUK22_03695, partial [Thermoguttaceae bacterium]|nr:hypothetical protein [Thermoguttaceae bacterium]
AAKVATDPVARLTVGIILGLAVALFWSAGRAMKRWEKAGRFEASPDETVAPTASAPQKTEF